MVFVILNGPAESGKSSAAVMLAHALQGKVRGLVDPLRGFMEQARLPKSGMVETLNSTGRQFMINLSNFIKQQYGKDVWTRLLLRRMTIEHSIPYVIVDDCCASQEEIDAFPEDSVVIFVHRPGVDFEGDNRLYVDPKGKRTFDLINTGGHADLANEVEQIAREIKNAQETA
jgi:hypothetical protein